MLNETRIRLQEIPASEKRARLCRLVAHYSDETANHCNVEDADAMQWALDTIAALEMERDRTTKEHEAARQRWRWSSEQVQALAAQVAEARAEAAKERQYGYAQANTLCDQITSLRSEKTAMERELRVLRHGEALALERSKRGITDCSTPLHIRIENIVDALKFAESEREDLRKQLKRKQKEVDALACQCDQFRTERRALLDKIAAATFEDCDCRTCDDIRAILSEFIE